MTARVYRKSRTLNNGLLVQMVLPLRCDTLLLQTVCPTILVDLCHLWQVLSEVNLSVFATNDGACLIASLRGYRNADTTLLFVGNKKLRLLVVPSAV